MLICVDPGRKAPVDLGGADANCVDIGLINNMPDSALEATERQFLALLDAAAEGIVVRLSLYALPDVPRTDSGRRYLSRCHAGLDELWDRQLDGLIVTGTEPTRALPPRFGPAWQRMQPFSTSTASAARPSPTSALVSLSARRSPIT